MFLFLLYFAKTSVQVKSVKPVLTSQNAASEVGTHCMYMSPKRVSGRNCAISQISLNLRVMLHFIKFFSEYFLTQYKYAFCTSI